MIKVRDGRFPSYPSTFYIANLREGSHNHRLSLPQDIAVYVKNSKDARMMMGVL